MSGALDGIRVVDFGQYIAGPLAAMLLADHGAEVIRVESPNDYRWKTPANATWNRNKRSIVLDLKQAVDHEVALNLIANADVLIENFRPGVMTKLGLGSVAMMGANSSLIYCSLPGFASDDPRAALPAWEGILGAATGTYRGESPAGHPVYSAIPVSSCFGSFQAAISIVMALLARQRDGFGQTIEVPLFDATFAAIGSSGLRMARPAPSRQRRMRGVWTGQYECKDGRWFQYNSANKGFPSFLEKTGSSAWAESDISRDDMTKRVQSFFRTRTANEWESFCESMGTEGAMCRTSAEWMQDEHALASETVVDVHDPLLGLTRVPGINVRLSETPGSIRFPRALPDGDREATLAAFTAPRSHTKAASEESAASALQGTRVLDLCIVLAGPTCGRTLAEYGADVIKIYGPEPPDSAGYNDVNRGKRSLLLDLKTKEGLEVFWRLVDSADVVSQNFALGVAERLGIGYEAVKARRPDIVYVSLNAYGRVGPYAPRRGHEQIGQAATGMEVRYGGDGKPEQAPYSLNDYGTGLMGAYGAALALFSRSRTGRGQHVYTSLAQTATLLQSPFMQTYAGKTWEEPHGQDALGSSALNRAYETRDGWLFVSGSRDNLTRHIAYARFAGLSEEQLAATLESELHQITSERAISDFIAAGFAAHKVVREVDELMNDDWVKAHGLSVTREHDGAGPVTTVGPAPRLTRTPVRVGAPAAPLGSDTTAVLREIGFGADVERLLREKIVFDRPTQT